VLREESPATFSVSIETEATFLLFQLGLVDRVIVFSMSVLAGATGGAMRTSQAFVARLESGKVSPSTRTLERFAKATHTRLRISFEPENSGQEAPR
jgi:hypothetical protein